MPIKTLLAAALLAALHAPASGAFDRNPAADAARAEPAAVATGRPPATRRGIEEPAAPIPTLEALRGWRPAIRGQVAPTEPSLRERAVRETALRVGGQAALARRTRERNAEVEAQAKWLDEIYRFDQLLMEKGLVLPPVVIEARRHAEVDGLKLARIEQAYKMTETAQVVSAPPTWRDYLIASGHEPPAKPEGALLPQNAEEERLWAEAVEAGWTQGELQAELAFRARVGELHRAFLGRVRFLVLLERGMVTAPAVRVVRRGVKLERNELLIGRTEVALSRFPRFRGPTRRGRLPWKALPEVPTTYDDGASVQ
jgi:hypothetical protein